MHSLTLSVRKPIVERNIYGHQDLFPLIFRTLLHVDLPVLYKGMQGESFISEGILFSFERMLVNLTNVPKKKERERDQWIVLKAVLASQARI